MYQLNVNGQLLASSGVLMDILRIINESGIDRQSNFEVFQSGNPMTVVLDSYGKFGIQQEGSVEEIFLRLLNEVEVHYIRPRGGVLQPWQMMPNAWRAFVMLGSAAYNVYPCFTAMQRAERLTYQDYQKRDTSGSITYYMMAEMYRRYGYDHNGPLYGPNRGSNSRHDVHVAYALAEGKPVPVEVIEWYKQDKTAGRYDVGDWFRVLLDWPEYRGMISGRKLHALTSALKGSDITLTSENAPYFIRQLAVLKEDVSFTEVDDHLFQIGAIKPAEIVIHDEKPDVSQSYSPFAYTLRQMLGEHRKQNAIEYAQEQRAKNRCTLRNLEEELARAALLPEYESFSYPNKFAAAVEMKDIDMLLTYLDTPDDRNITTKKAMRDVFGLKVMGLKAAVRRDAVFAFCGYDAEQRAKYERKVADQAAAAERESEIERVKEMAEANKVRMSSTSAPITIAEFVDRSVAEGYTVITTSRKGATTQYWLSNPQTGYSRGLKKKDGSLEYAQLVCGLAVQPLAA